MTVYPVAILSVGVAAAILDCLAREFRISMMLAFENKLPRPLNLLRWSSHRLLGSEPCWMTAEEKLEWRKS